MVANVVFGADPGSVQHVYPEAGKVQGGNIITIAGKNLGAEIVKVEFVTAGLTSAATNRDDLARDPDWRSIDGVLKQKPESVLLKMHSDDARFDPSTTPYWPTLVTAQAAVTQASTGATGWLYHAFKTDVTYLVVIVTSCEGGVSLGPTACKRYRCLTLFAQCCSAPTIA